GKGGEFVALAYSHDHNDRDSGIKTARFDAKLPKAGKYELRISYADLANRSSKAKVIIGTKGGEKVVTVNQRKKPEIDGLFTSLGTFEFGEESIVTISNEGSDGHVIADAVQWLPK
ncbi:MAG TPA: FAD-dependent oxidoreductase, partial [Luteolibacter sp.]|nr:FAD-dependent oxidoreductase [Luteolibacter sp.]